MSPRSKETRMRAAREAAMQQADAIAKYIPNLDDSNVEDETLVAWAHVSSADTEGKHF